MKHISKLRSRIYSKIIEVRIPVRFYWGEEGYDGFEFGPLEGCSHYQLRLLGKVVEQLAFEHNCALVGAYLERNHPDKWVKLLSMIEAEKLGIPQTVLEAFNE